jgi:hypothetical protein
MEWLLGLEPLTALTVGVGAVILAPVVNAIGHVTGQDSNKLGEAVSTSAREWTKDVIVMGFEAMENVQAFYAEAEESFKDLVSDAKVEHMAKKGTPESVEGREVEIVSE